MAESRASLPPRSIAACSDRPARGYLALLNANRLPSEAEPIKAFSWCSSVDDDDDDDDDDEVGISCRSGWSRGSCRAAAQQWCLVCRDCAERVLDATVVHP